MGLLLNGLTLKVFQRGARSSRCVTVYLKNLAAADFLLTLCLPFRIAKHAGAFRLHLWVYCSFGAPAFYLNMYASILFMGYIAANRYLKIVHPLGTHSLQSVRAAHVVSTISWLVLLTLAGTYVVLSLVSGQALTRPSSCEEQLSGQLKVFYKAAHVFSAAIFLLVLAALLFFYGSTSRRLAAVQRRRPSSSGSRRLARSRRNMLVLSAIFCVCFVPYHLVRLPYAVSEHADGSAFFYLKEAAVALSVLNVCLDPLIYFTFCKAFRQQPGRGGAIASAKLAIANPETSDGQMLKKTSGYPSTTDFT
ncbi:P2Y purinoceptor 14-like isoform X2 [Corythoichthys intestinalis]|nr:P2Y purinoceptor 14-like isoform X2 [Corythoichthys intestinalis]XP_061811929.1 P2Y purinoceptor 14-like [Nerophis lumbriciformis]